MNMYNTVKCFSENTSLVERDGCLYIKKRISADDLELFQKLRTLSSPFLARVFEITVDEEYLFAIIEYIPGKTLAEFAEETSPIPLRSILLLSIDICRGLSVLHKNGIVHRDINPNNIIVAPDGRAVIIDFGISRTEKEGKSADTTVLGTAGYAAPEQFGFRQTSAQSDIYSVGALLNFLCNGTYAIEESEKNDLEAIIGRCTMIKPEERFRSADELCAALTLIFNRLFPKEKLILKKSGLKAALFGIYYSLASVFLAFFVSIGEPGEKVFMFFLAIFALFLPPFFGNLFNSRQRLFYYKNLRSKRVILTLSSTLICLTVAFIIFIFITQKWADG